MKPTNRRSTPKLLRASLTLTGAVALGLVSYQRYLAADFGFALAAAAAAVALCFHSVLLTAPHVVRARWDSARRGPSRSPITAQGTVYIFFTLLAAGAAVYSGNNLVYLVLSAMFAAMAAAGLVSRLGLAGLRLRLALPDHVFAGEPVAARIGVRNVKRWMPSFSLWLSGADGPAAGMRLEEAYFPAIAPGEESNVSIRAVFDRRGRFLDEAVVLRTAFPFGFIVRQATLKLSQEVIVYPSVEPTERALGVLRALDAPKPRAMVGESHDLYRIRPAQAGDGARHLDWKASARGGGLWLREYAREDARRARLSFDRRPSNSPEEFERRVAAAACVVWNLYRVNAEIEFRSDEFRAECPARSPEIYRVLRYLACVEPAAEASAADRASPPCDYRFEANADEDASASSDSRDARETTTGPR